MGSKFANLNIRGGTAEAVSALCPDCLVREPVPGWVTAAGEWTPRQVLRLYELT